VTRAPHIPQRRQVTRRLRYRGPFDAGGLLEFLARRAVRGVEELTDGVYRRSLRLPRGPAVVDLEPADGHVRATFLLDDVRDLSAAVSRCRGLLDLDSDPAPVFNRLAPDPVIGPMVRAAPGRRVPGSVDPHELAIRTVIGQQISVSAARTVVGRLVQQCGEPLEHPVGSVTHVFPPADVVAAADPEKLPMPRARGRTLVALGVAAASGDLVLESGADRLEVRRRLQEVPGIGPWTAEYFAMRALRDPDAFPAGDLGLRRALERLGHDGSPAGAAALAEGWRPYRAYALQYLWGTAGSPTISST
jgi:AraC family transcriptional regulator of adaptative response / DNA-3-methyladenine glycosylase II